MRKNYYDVIIIGAGPTGIFAALELLKKDSGLDILILEKGTNLQKRICPMNTRDTKCVKCSSCAIVSGWGGAGAYSDGKLSLSPEIGGNLHEYIGWDKLSELIEYADDIYMNYGAPDRIFGVNEDIIEDIKEKSIKSQLKFIPATLRHLGTGYSQTVLQAMQDFIVEQGVDIRFGENVKELVVEDEKIKAVRTADGDIITAGYVVAAPGRENAEWLSNEANRLNI
ncbi:MAG: FAD-dependent oxidoreductase, partial [bacterium]